MVDDNRAALGHQRHPTVEGTEIATCTDIGRATRCGRSGPDVVVDQNGARRAAKDGRGAVVVAEGVVVRGWRCESNSSFQEAVWCLWSGRATRVHHRTRCRGMAIWTRERFT